MANTKSAIKRIRRISKQTVVNKARKSRYKNALKKMNLLVEGKKKNEALNTRVLKAQKKVVQNNIRTTAQQSRVVRTRNSNGTISVQNPTIDLKPKGAGNGKDFLKR